MTKDNDITKARFKVRLIGKYLFKIKRFNKRKLKCSLDEKVVYPFST